MQKILLLIFLHFIDLNFAIAYDLNATSSVDKEIETIQMLSVQKGKLSKAIEDLQKILKLYPENISLHILNAKLLYWNHQTFLAKKEIFPYKKYDKNLYQNISIAWAVEEINHLKKPSKKIKFVYTLEPYVWQSYDILWVYIESLVQTNQLQRALKNTKLLVEKYPKSKEAQERLATLLFWNHYYKDSLKKYQILAKKYKKSYQKEIKQLQEIIDSKSQKKVVQTSSQNPLIQNISTIKRINQRSYSKNMIGFGGEKIFYSDERYKDQAFYFETVFPVNSNTFYLKGETIRHYKKKNTQISGEFYPKLPAPHWGFVSFSYASNSDFLTKNNIGWHHYYEWKKWQFGLSYDYNSYVIQTTKQFSAEYVYYLKEHLMIRQVYFYLPSNKSWALLNEFKQQTPWHCDWFIDFIVSNAHESEESEVVVNVKKSQFKIGGEYPFQKQYSIGGSVSREWFVLKSNDYNYHTLTLNLFLRRYW